MNPFEKTAAPGLEMDQVVCPDALADLRLLDPDDDGGLFRDIILMFLEECPALMGRAGQALERGDASAVAKHAHSIKGASANFGAHRLREMAFRLETAGNRANLAEASRLLPILKQAFEDVRVELLSYVED